MEGGVPTVLILGHSFVRRLRSDLSRNRIPGAYTHFNLRDVAEIYFHGIGGRTVAKVVEYDLDVVRRIRPHIVILEIGTNDLHRHVRPETVGSAIEDLVQLLLNDFNVSVVCACHVIPRGMTSKDPIGFALKARKLCAYLEVVLEPVERAFCWRHALFTAPSKDLYTDGVHLNRIGQASLYRSYRGAILKALNYLR